MSFEDLINMFNACDKLRDYTFRCENCDCFKNRECAGIEGLTSEQPVTDDFLKDLLIEQEEQM